MKKYFYLLFLLFVFYSCHVTLVPLYDSGVVSRVSSAAKVCDKIMLQAEEADGADRSYAKFKDKYIDAEADLNDLLRMEQNRSKGEDLVKITNNIITEFIKYKDRHKAEDSAITAAVLELEREYLSDHFNILLAAEKALK